MRHYQQMTTNDGAELRIGIEKDAIVLVIARGDSTVESSLEREEALLLGGWLRTAVEQPPPADRQRQTPPS